MFLVSSFSVAVTNKVDVCKNLDFSFGSSRECDFILKLVEVRRNNRL